jgi:5-methylcytosine-specific restriction protein B
MFSPKVLDRANVIEFKISPYDMNNYLNHAITLDLRKAYSICDNMAEDFVKQAISPITTSIPAKQIKILQEFFEQLKSVNAEFGYRTVNEICRYLSFAQPKMKPDEAMDTAILQKLLPKLHGSQKKLKPVLTEIWKKCLKTSAKVEITDDFDKKNFVYPETAEKIQRMYRALLDFTFTSFAEA